MSAGVFLDMTSKDTRIYCLPRERGGFPYRTPEQELAAVLAHNILGAYVTYRLCGQSSKTESTPGS